MQDSPVAARTAASKDFHVRGMTANSMSVNSFRSAESAPLVSGLSVTKATVSWWSRAR